MMLFCVGQFDAVWPFWVTEDRSAADPPTGRAGSCATQKICHCRPTTQPGRFAVDERRGIPISRVTFTAPPWACRSTHHRLSSSFVCALHVSSVLVNAIRARCLRQRCDAHSERTSLPPSKGLPACTCRRSVRTASVLYKYKHLKTTELLVELLVPLMPLIAGAVDWQKQIPTPQQERAWPDSPMVAHGDYTTMLFVASSRERAVCVLNRFLFEIHDACLQQCSEMEASRSERVGRGLGSNCLHLWVQKQYQPHAKRGMDVKQ